MTNAQYTVEVNENGGLMTTRIMSSQDLETAISAETGQLLSIEMQMHNGPYPSIDQIITWKERISGIRKRIRATIAEYSENQ